MFTGQVDQISNRATWVSETYELYDDDDGTTTDLTTYPDLAIEVTIRGVTSPGLDYGLPDRNIGILVSGSIDDGKVVVPGPGFYWRFEDTDLGGLCAGTYRLGVKITIDNTVIDEIIGTIAVLEGN